MDNPASRPEVDQATADVNPQPGPLPPSDSARHASVPRKAHAHQARGTPVPQQSLKSRATKLVTPSKKKTGPPGGFDSTPLPDAPQGYDVRFCFRYASNLPPADIHTGSADPFIIATLRGNNPKRHKDDPDLTYRTKTLRRTSEPKWEEEWVVANVPPNGFTLKCRMYDEDWPDQNDRLGNVTIKVPELYEDWEGIPYPGKEFTAKKRVISKRALALKVVASALSRSAGISPRLCISIQLLKKSDPPYAQMCTLGPNLWAKHFSPMIGWLAGTKVNANGDDHREANGSSKGRKSPQKYDFQANQMQLVGPVPSKLYHRYVEFKPIIGSMYSSSGLRGKILHMALHKQHQRIYNFGRSTQWGSFEPCSREASLQFLRLAHFDEGGRVFTYVLTLDGLFRFTETGKEFGIDLLSKHTMHSDVEKYIACAGEFFIRRLEKPDASDDPGPHERTHPNDELPGGPPLDDPPLDPSYYQLVIDNDSGTYRPDKCVLPTLKSFLERNFPGLGIAAMHWEEEDLQKMKEAQTRMKKKEGRIMNLVENRSMSSISSAESELEHRDRHLEHDRRSKREKAFAVVEDPTKITPIAKSFLPHRHHNHNGEDKE
ncbi:hypothetical protein S7711_05507 [Stachybotrys chartarum IBT 7711]|uniref:C2 domain-containing protein n=1 Tax=Stachybotrys chartarum (strain CBS 109288 / IBT 7711) TaxID=1280523 RepID=A0A084AS18_STACB|nr:hypothetical protein S7711_05507 [Stachybotrys chartarum IBT 7711]KFA53388.1 hypothetical protein S40293_03463 [Stachybotrys chartarum IBT 40293]